MIICRSEVMISFPAGVHLFLSARSDLERQRLEKSRRASAPGGVYQPQDRATAVCLTGGSTTSGRLVHVANGLTSMAGGSYAVAGRQLVPAGGQFMPADGQLTTTGGRVGVVAGPFGPANVQLVSTAGPLVSAGGPLVAVGRPPLVRSMSQVQSRDQGRIRDQGRTIDQGRTMDQGWTVDQGLERKIKREDSQLVKLLQDNRKQNQGLRSVILGDVNGFIADGLLR